MQTIKSFLEKSGYWLAIMVAGIVTGITFRYVGAWVEPNQMPPGGNIAAPLNTGNIGQSKQGGLTLNIGGATYGLIVDKGLVGIQTTTPQAELDVNGDIRAHNLNLNQNLNVAGDGYFGGNLNVNGDIHARNFIVSNVNSNTNVSIGPNGLCLNGVCKTSWEEVCATCGSAGAGSCSTLVGTSTSCVSLESGNSITPPPGYIPGSGAWDLSVLVTYDDYGSHCTGVCHCQPASGCQPAGRAGNPFNVTGGAECYRACTSGSAIYF